MSARGSSRLSLGGMTADYVVTMELDRAAVPRLVTAKGTSSTGPLDDTLELRGAESRLTRDGSAQTIPATPGAAYVGNNLFWPLVFVLARYEPETGGAQQIPVFPSLTASLRYAGPDTVTPATAAAGPPRAYHRYALTLGPAPIVLWTDDAGRFAALHVAAARLLVTDARDAAFAPALASAAGSGAAVRPPDYSPPPDAPFTAEQVVVEADGFTLAGTLLLPKNRRGPHPAAITITGSGQQTRDSALPIPGLERYAPFREIAETLAARGIAVLRVDDRGVGGSTGAATLSTATSSSFAGDVQAQLRFLRARADIDGARIALVGHSEGALIAPIVATRDTTVAALVLMAGTALRGDSVLREQMEDALARNTALNETQRAGAREQQRETLRRLAAGDSVPGITGAAWLREFIAFDPLETIARVRQPVLVLQGAHDRQVLEHHAHAIVQSLERSGNTRTALHVFPTLNHLFLPSETGAISEYGSLEQQSLPDVLLGTLSDWLADVLNVR
jgi:dipeptidyl aminopeptidase/acylaminoacyl peptidase